MTLNFFENPSNIIPKSDLEFIWKLQQYCTERHPWISLKITAILYREVQVEPIRLRVVSSWDGWRKNSSTVKKREKKRGLDLDVFVGLYWYVYLCFFLVFSWQIFYVYNKNIVFMLWWIVFRCVHVVMDCVPLCSCCDGWVFCTVAHGCCILISNFLASIGFRIMRVS